jgi:UrcA family protein
VPTIRLLPVDNLAIWPPDKRIKGLRRGESFSPQPPRRQRRRDMIKTISAIAALLVASALVVPTVSQASVSNSVRVSYADLNLGSETGAWILERRISSAARIVCEIEDSRELALRQATVVCRTQAIADAQPAFNAALAAARNPSVTALPATITVIAR